eukprot:2867359-Rhodomonas_salina.1
MQYARRLQPGTNERIPHAFSEQLTWENNTASFPPPPPISPCSLLSVCSRHVTTASPSDVVVRRASSAARSGARTSRTRARAWPRSTTPRSSKLPPPSTLPASP